MPMVSKPCQVERVLYLLAHVGQDEQHQHDTYHPRDKVQEEDHAPAEVFRDIAPNDSPDNGTSGLPHAKQPHGHAPLRGGTHCS